MTDFLRRHKVDLAIAVLVVGVAAVAFLVVRDDEGGTSSLPEGGQGGSGTPDVVAPSGPEVADDPTCEQFESIVRSGALGRADIREPETLAPLQSELDALRATDPPPRVARLLDDLEAQVGDLLDPEQRGELDEEALDAAELAVAATVQELIDVAVPLCLE